MELTALRNYWGAELAGYIDQVHGLGFPRDTRAIQDGNIWTWTVRVEMDKEYYQLCMRGEGVDLLLPSGGVSCCFPLVAPTQESFTHLGDTCSTSCWDRIWHYLGFWFLQQEHSSFPLSNENAKHEQEELTPVSGKLLYLNRLLPSLWLFLQTRLHNQKGWGNLRVFGCNVEPLPCKEH